MWDSTTVRITAMRLLYQGTTLVVPKKDGAQRLPWFGCTRVSCQDTPCDRTPAAPLN
jgi:hypothetical protein